MNEDISIDDILICLREHFMKHINACLSSGYPTSKTHLAKAEAVFEIERSISKMRNRARDNMLWTDIQQLLNKPTDK